MSDETKNKIALIFAWCIAFAFCFIIVAIVGGFIMSRLLGLPVDVPRFYTTVSPIVYMIVGAILNPFGGKKA